MVAPKYGIKKRENIVRATVISISRRPSEKLYLGIPVHHFVILPATKEPQGVPETDADQNDLQKFELCHISIKPSVRTDKDKTMFYIPFTERERESGNQWRCTNEENAGVIDDD